MRDDALPNAERTAKRPQIAGRPSFSDREEPHLPICLSNEAAKSEQGAASQCPSPARVSGSVRWRDAVRVLLLDEEHRLLL